MKLLQSKKRTSVYLYVLSLYWLLLASNKVYFLLLKLILKMHTIGMGILETFVNSRKLDEVYYL